ncbi:MAG TPA: UDP-N-acetylmuramate dehydrogenase [Actinobacteria bacterium]|nr:UDP-N-acetylmuramate dehydrogenase [Actinomycetota bacterium]
MKEHLIKRLYERLHKSMPDNVVADKPLAKLTTLRVGGKASIFATVDTLAELRLIIQGVKDYELPFLILGRGSNILISDEGLTGVVFQLGVDFSHMVVEGDEIRAGAAVTLASLVQTALRNKLGGLSFAVGIPGTVGAAVTINAGAQGSAMSDLVKNVTYYSTDCRLQKVGIDQLGYGYRTSRIPKDAVVVEARLGLSLSSTEIIKSQMETNWRRRKASQPVDMPNAGSMFKNPDNDSAGRLIEAAGCKGLKVGGAQVSEKHANFFINTDHASAADFYLLMRSVAASVEETSGVVLEPEIKIIGDWSYASR